ncbi:MAG: GntP family permease [Phycisphaera sp.]|nr:GntP family permease [Phycisphaera sp.]
MIVVVGGILVLRLHAFLALILGALIVAALTPRDAIYREGVNADSLRVVQVSNKGDGVALLRVGKKQSVVPGRVHVLRDDPMGGPPLTVLDAELDEVGKAGGLTAVTLHDGGAQVILQPGDRVIHHTQIIAANDEANEPIGNRVADGFGKTAVSIGILIAMAAIIGKCLLESGAAERIVVAVQSLLGEPRTPIAFLISGFTLGVPVFFDTVFYLLMPLGKAMRLRTGRNYVLYILCIVAGATMAHSLVPPTPGPLFVAAELGVDVGAMMLAGLGLGLCTVTAGYVYAKWANRRWDIPLRASAELTASELDAMAHRDPATLPPLGLSLLPIVLPVVLIAGATILKLMAKNFDAEWAANLLPTMDVIGNKNIALVIAAVVSLWLLGRQKHIPPAQLSKSVQVALESGGVIILVTAAGGAFGHVLKQTGIAGYLADMLNGSTSAWLLLPLAFGITTLVRIAQGSATVAMITAVGVVAPLAAAAPLGFHPVYLALAIGCGSKPISWMNDSGFWIIGRMSGMTEGETLKTASTMMALMGVVGLIVTMIAAWLLPMA